MIGIGFGGLLYYNHSKEPPKLGLVYRLFVFQGLGLVVVGDRNCSVPELQEFVSLGVGRGVQKALNLTLKALLLLMAEILQYLKVPKLWKLWYIPYYGECWIYIINCKF